MNKIATVILALLLLFTGGLGYYSYNLNQQIGQLGEQLSQQAAEQASRITGVSGELAAQGAQTGARLDTLNTSLGKTGDQVNTLQQKITDTQGGVNDLKQEINSTQDKITQLQTDLASVSGLSPSVIKASDVYAKVAPATVRISNGTRTLGSGFLWDRAGHIMTANHVIEGLDQIYIVFEDGKISEATDRASSVSSDVAILTIADRPAITPPSQADSSQVQVGQPVVAIGAPLDLPDSLSAGVISQKDRFVDIQGDTGTRWVGNLLQFDAAANFGNSGCPLVNAAGEIIGMVVARVRPTEGDGINYAVSSNKMKKVAAALIANGSFPYPWVGVNTTDLTPQVARARGLPDINGVLVAGVLAGGPAAQAGLRTDDIILGIDQFIIRNSADLISYLGENKSPGQTAALEILRGNQKLNISVTVGVKPE